MKKISTMQSYLMILFTTCLVISNLLAAKQLYLPFGFSVAGGTLVFPITYILSDVFSEVYGYVASRKQAYIGFAVNLFVNVIYIIFLAWPGAGPDYSVLSTTPRMLIASGIAYLIGDWVNDVLFRNMKYEADHTNAPRIIQDSFVFRATFSSFVGEMIDTAIFLVIAFYGTPVFEILPMMWLPMVACKTLYEIIISPVTLIICKRLRLYEDK